MAMKIGVRAKKTMHGIRTKSALLAPGLLGVILSTSFAAQDAVSRDNTVSNRKGWRRSLCIGRDDRLRLTEEAMNLGEKTDDGARECDVQCETVPWGKEEI